MSIASELSALNGYILGAYDEINDKGGTVPANKNMANLASAIASISTGTPTTITPLSVTENGTYTAPTGTAYSPVTVNVSGGGSNNNWSEVMGGSTTALYDGDITNVADYAFMVGDTNRTSPTGNFTETKLAKITSASFPSVTSVGTAAFWFWYYLQSMSLPSCERIGDKAFRYCQNLQSLTAPKVEYIGQYTFANCASLLEAKLPLINDFPSSAIQRIGYFYNCTSIKLIDLGNNATSLPSAHATFYSNCFNGCTSLKALVLRMPNLITANVSNINNSGISAGTGYVYVPANLVDSYKSASGWSTYASQIRAIEDYSSDGTVDGDITV